MRLFYTYTVAGHPFRLEIPASFPIDEVLSPYLPFKGMTEGCTEPIFTLRVEKDVTHLRGKTPGQLIYRGDIHLISGFTEMMQTRPLAFP